MKVIDKLGRKLAKDFNKKFEHLSKDQLKIMQKTSVYQIFSNNNGYSKIRNSNSSDLDHIDVLKLMTVIANDIVNDKDVKNLLASEESSNIILAANIVNKKLK